jgi:hypothetical protein
MKMRRSQRYKVKMYLQCRHSGLDGGEVTQVATVCNASHCGLELEAETLPLRDDMVECEGKVGDEETRFLSMVRWSDKDRGRFGVEMMQFDLGSKEQWKSMLEKCNVSRSSEPVQPAEA